ncbi:MAG: hypothetical protein EOP88_23030 [Verrucomicrobiaceae bacterium]|nr:MAG: hypothetical protein EOP88_23030 [Verrucomicrobiaceae bacterium]
MKKLLIALFATFGVLAPATILAAPVSQLSASVKKYGGFKPGHQFTLRVVDKDVDKIAGSVPNEIPNFKEGNKIEFTIGKKGELTARDGVWVKYDDGSKGKNRYQRTGSRPTKLTSHATIYKDKKGTPTSGKLVFNIVSFDNILPMPYEVTYRLKK